MRTFAHYTVSLILILFGTGISFIYAQSNNLFEGKNIFKISLSGEISKILKDREGEATYYPVSLSYSDANDKKVEIPVKVRTRGNFRRRKGVCNYPPLLINFSKENRKESIFSEQDKLKLVMPCHDEKYVLHEYYVYKLYNLVTEKSFRTRLVQVELNDPKIRGKRRGPFYGFLLEEEDQMAQRNSMISIDKTLVRPDQTTQEDFLYMAVFEYLIGNTDWSVQYRQNVKLIAQDSLAKPITVPYDFDHAGLVGAPYAHPAPELLLQSTKERRYRGFCITDMANYENVISHYNTLKEKFYGIYIDNPYLDKRYIRTTLKYLDDFYAIINDPKKLEREFQYPCLEHGTGNIIIKGLKN